jgi:protease-4
VHTDGLATTKTAAGMRADRPLSPEVATAIQAGVDHVYDAFIRHVAEGRHLRPQAVRAVAAGRVWTGRDALARKLVDHLGELPEAIAAAAKRAKLGTTYAVQRIRPKRTLRERLLEAMLGKARAWAAHVWPEQAMINRLTARTLAHLPPLATDSSGAPAILAWSDASMP